MSNLLIYLSVCFISVEYASLKQIKQILLHDKRPFEHDLDGIGNSGALPAGVQKLQGTKERGEDGENASGKFIG